MLTRCGSGDSNSWNEAVEQFGPLVRWAITDRFFRSIKYIDENEIDEIFQQAFINLWHRLKTTRIKNPRTIPAFLIITAHNAAADFFRKKRKFSQLHIELIKEHFTSTKNNPRTEADNNRLYNEIEGLINLLPVKERRIMTLELFYDLKHKEIAEIMGISINTVSTIAARIKHSLADKLRRRGYDVN